MSRRANERMEGKKVEWNEKQNNSRQHQYRRSQSMKYTVSNRTKMSNNNYPNEWLQMVRDTLSLTHTSSMRVPSDQLDWTVCINSVITIIITAAWTNRPTFVLTIECNRTAIRGEKMPTNWLTDWLTDGVNEWNADGPAQLPKNHTMSICFINEKKVATQMPAVQFNWKWWLDRLFFLNNFFFSLSGGLTCHILASRSLSSISFIFFTHFNITDWSTETDTHWPDKYFQYEVPFNF